MCAASSIEEGTTTTPFDMVVLNQLDRYHLAIEVINRVPGLVVKATELRQHCEDRLMEHTRYVRLHGEDMPEIRSGTGPTPLRLRRFKIVTAAIESCAFHRRRQQ